MAAQSYMGVFLHCPSFKSNLFFMASLKIKQQIYIKENSDNMLSKKVVGKGHNSYQQFQLKKYGNSLPEVSSIYDEDDYRQDL